MESLRRIKSALMRMLIADALILHDKDNARWSIESITLEDGCSTFVVYKGDALVMIEPSYKTDRAGAIERLLRYVQEQRLTLDPLLTDQVGISGAHSQLWTARVRELKSLSNTGAWCFTGSPFTGRLKSVHICPLESMHKVIYNAKKVKRIVTTKHLEERLWLQSKMLLRVPNHSYVRVGKLIVCSAGEVTFKVVQKAGYANVAHFRDAWESDYHKFRNTLPVVVFEVNAIYPASLTTQRLPAPCVDDYTDLPLFKRVYA